MGVTCLHCKRDESHFKVGSAAAYFNHVSCSTGVVVSLTVIYCYIVSVKVILFVYYINHIMMSSEEDCEDNHCESGCETVVNTETRKKKSFGRSSDVMKHLRLVTHELGNDCRCKRLKCFERIKDVDRKSIISQFNGLKNRNEQSLYLAGLITVYDIKKRRPRKSEDEAAFKDKSYTYKVRIKTDNGNQYEEIPVCYKAFLSLHGVTAKRVQNIQKALKCTGKAPTDLRGHYDHKHCRMTEEKTQVVINHIRSFKGRSSHYSLNKTKKTYLPEQLNISKMYQLYKELYGRLHPVSYEAYRKIFNSKFNISFGYPRSDSCSTCDKHSAEIKVLNLKLNDASLKDEERVKIMHYLLQKGNSQ